MISACLMMRLAPGRRLIALLMAGIFVILIRGGGRIRLFWQGGGVRGVLGSRCWI